MQRLILHVANTINNLLVCYRHEVCHIWKQAADHHNAEDQDSNALWIER